LGAVLAAHESLGNRFQLNRAATPELALRPTDQAASVLIGNGIVHEVVPNAAHVQE
jgi:hypothetical protein